VRLREAAELAREFGASLELVCVSAVTATLMSPGEIIPHCAIGSRSITSFQ